MTAFSLHQAHFSTGGHNLLSNISLTVIEGRVTGIFGQNGSGKSTLIRLMAGQIAPTSGQVLFRNRTVTDYAPRDLARRLAHLPQTPPAVPGLSLRDLVALGRYPSHGALGRFGPADHRAVKTALELTGLSSISDRQVDLLSGGERQRGWIAMLLAQGAEVLLLDEPISALDIAHQIEVLSLLRNLNREYGLSVIMVLHDLNLAMGYCDDVIALQDGSLITHGPIAELHNPDLLRRLYGVDMETITWRGSRLILPTRMLEAGTNSP